MAKRLAQFPEKSASEKTKSDIAELKSDYDAVKEKMTQAQGHFDTLVKLLDVEKRKEFTEMVKVLEERGSTRRPCRVWRRSWARRRRRSATGP